MTSVCAIVGAGKELGSALAAKFASAGYDIALISGTKAGSANSIKAARKARADVNVQYFQADAANAKKIEQAVSNVARKLGHIDILICNAPGKFASAVPQEMTYEALEETFQKEVSGTLAAAKSALPTMRKRKLNRGGIYFISASTNPAPSDDPLDIIGNVESAAISESLSKVYSGDGVHFAHFWPDCDLDDRLSMKCMAIVLTRYQWQVDLMSRKQAKQAKQPKKPKAKS